ncbi:MAG: hypothetical protein MJK12_00075 [Colwellia sp.]|nr:hypothetical protein [Colwellia sp.]
MYINLWGFLTAAVVLVTLLVICIVFMVQKTKVKQLEIEALKIKSNNLDLDAEDMVNKNLQDQLSRIEILEAIVTDKNYDLSERITQLK